MEDNIIYSIDRARKAQQENEQKHDVQLEMTLYDIEEEEAWRAHTKHRIEEMSKERKENV